jgi:precorrin-2 dehydrogenase / sirohydrochlorin ferrochelatase
MKRPTRGGSGAVDLYGRPPRPTAKLAGLYYPAMLDLRGRRAIVIGGGEIGTRKVKEFLACGARVTVISPKPSKHIEALAHQKTLALRRRAYRRGDLAGAEIAVVATDDPGVQECAWREAQARGIFVNTVDEVKHCSFITPSILRRGPLTVAVSTSGTSPGIARRIRERLESYFPRHFGECLELAAAARKKMRVRGADYATLDRFAGAVFDLFATYGALELPATDGAVDLYGRPPRPSPVEHKARPLQKKAPVEHKARPLQNARPSRKNDLNEAG